jgi:hypothetical protein
VVVEIFEALEQLRVEIDEVVMGGEQRRCLAVGCLQHVIGVRAVDRLEGEVRALEKQARPLHRDDRVGEGRRSGTVGDRKHFALLLRHSGEQGRQIIAVPDLREIRRAEGQRARLGEGIRRRQGGGASGASRWSGERWLDGD